MVEYLYTGIVTLTLSRTHLEVVLTGFLKEFGT
jgi:hypothetical protein